MRRAVHRIVVPTLLAALLAQAACSVPRRPTGPVEGGADGLPTAEIAMAAADVCAGWQVTFLSPGGAEGGIEPPLPETGIEGGEDGFQAQGLTGLPDAPWCFADGISTGWRPLIEGLGAVIAWSPFGGADDTADDGHSGGGHSSDRPAGATPYLTYWPAWPGSRGARTSGGPPDTRLAGAPAQPQPGDVGGLLVVSPPRDDGGTSVVAEPGTLALLGAAMIALGLYRRVRD